MANTQTSEIWSLDIETACAIASCNKDSKCKHALYPHTSRITILAAANRDFVRYFHTVGEARDYFEGRRASFVGHNFTFDMAHLHRHGWTIPVEDWHADTMLMAAVIKTKIPKDWLDSYALERAVINKHLPVGHRHRKAGPGSLKCLAPFFLGIPRFWETPEDHANSMYVCKDAMYTYQLFEHFEKMLVEEKAHRFFYKYQMEGARTLHRARIRGISLDVEGMRQDKVHFANRAVALREELLTLWHHGITEFNAAGVIKTKKAGFNLSSSPQMRWLLKTFYGLNIKNFKDKESVGREVLQRLSDEGREDIGKFIEYKKILKLDKAFFNPYEMLHDNGILRPQFNSSGARTGRTSCSGPNIQQVPPPLRRRIRARPGYKLITKDESAIEPRLLAYFSEDRVLRQLFIDDIPFHAYNAVQFCGLKCDPREVKKKYKAEYDLAKEAGLSILYGAGAARLQAIAKKRGFSWTIDECKAKILNLRNAYPEVKAYKKRLDKHIEQGGAIYSIFGQPYFIDPEEAYMKGVNTQIQGSASQLVVESACRINRRFKEQGIDGEVIFTVHDEIVCEVHESQLTEAEEIVNVAMTDYKLNTKYGLVPLMVEGKVSDVWEK